MSSDQKIYSVSEVNSLIKSVLEMNIPPVWVNGEISTWMRAASGHAYFSLKDESSQLSCVIWKQNAGRLLFKPEDGMQVNVSGRISIYEKSGKYQLIAAQIQPVGLGELYQRFELLKERLSEEGLFDEDRKKPLPPYPFRIGVVTSPDGAVISDIINVLNRRAPYVELILEPVRVQGDGAAEEIAEGIEKLNFRGDVDLLIVGRGGGSIEDLWAFNEEIVARAIAESTVPVISAVGHEIDFTIADFSADLRAPTPSVAAELAAPRMIDLLSAIEDHSKSIYESVTVQIREIERAVDDIETAFSWERMETFITESDNKVNDISMKMRLNQEHIFQVLKLETKALQNSLDSLNPLSVLGRGYSIVSSEVSGEIISSFKQVKVNDDIRIKVHEGTLRGVIKEVSNGL